MSFRFTAEDFERYVKMDEHGGRHIWHYLEELLKEEFGVPFSAVPYIARGDRLQSLWFPPRGTPRSNWGNQAQFFLSRSIDKKNLAFGLMVECPTSSDVAQYGFDSDRDGVRLIDRLENDPDFVAYLDALVQQPGWKLGVNEWDKGWHHPANSTELLDLLKGMSADQGWGTDVERVLSAKDAIAAGDSIADIMMDAYQVVRPLWEAVIPDSVRTFLEGGEIRETAASYAAPPVANSRQISLHDYFASHGLHFSPLTLATYFTALQTKGFVILSGLSGSGKTKLAQYFADLLQSSGDEAGNYLFLSVRPDWRDGRPLLGYYNPLTEQYEASDFIRFILDASQEETAPRLADLQQWLEMKCETDDFKEWLDWYHATYDRLHGKPAGEMSAADLDLLWQRQNNGIASVGPAHPLKASDEELREATRIIQDASRTRGQRLIDTIQYLRGIPGNMTPWARTLRALAAFDPVSTIVHYVALRRLLRILGYERSFNLKQLVERNDSTGIDDGLAFLEVQAKRYCPTPDPLWRAMATWHMWEYLSGDAAPLSSVTGTTNPFFVLLDEMNISRVEYYFADFLSVLEGGRDKDGFTRETVKLHSFADGARDKEGALKPQDSNGRYVPPEISLPPNLYTVGTVNVDETTHAFSPKVLDRAFTIEITEVDFERYPASSDAVLSETELTQLHEKLLSNFTRSGRFGVVDKQEIRAFVASRQQYRLHLHTLTDALKPYDLHFAYRIFDEIISFCANAGANQLWTDLGGLDTAFDCAVLMKVLPKFHGPRSKLEQPLRAVLAWAINPTDPESMNQEAEEVTHDAAACLRLRQALSTHLSGGESTPFRYPNTAHKVVRMLQSLHTMGFASYA